ncbi:MAG: outer membrane lipoprotein carrier protein LolA [Betaproteobacteria bacterium]|nr:outer membrane lipoprotein carrier protein LolA [Betaproteobacteria bacterium]
MISLCRFIAVACLAWVTATLALAQSSADSLEALNQFLKQTHSGRAQFTQVVTSPAKADQAPRRKTSSGTFEFQKPQQFRFAYQKPFVQTMVSDGQSLWLYDADLNQVTVRKQSQLLGQTPAAFVASSGDLKSLQAEFNLKAEPEAEGLQWVKATPKQADGALQSLRVGLKSVANSTTPPVLSVLEIVDGLGQTSRLSFQNFEVNPKLPNDTFQFKTPAGAQVIRP